jgi:hypothetical protein
MVLCIVTVYAVSSLIGREMRTSAVCFVFEKSFSRIPENYLDSYKVTRFDGQFVHQVPTGPLISSPVVHTVVTLRSVRCKVSGICTRSLRGRGLFDSLSATNLSVLAKSTRERAIASSNVATARRLGLVLRAACPNRSALLMAFPHVWL